MSRFMDQSCPEGEDGSGVTVVGKMEGGGELRCKSNTRERIGSRMTLRRRGMRSESKDKSWESCPTPSSYGLERPRGSVICVSRVEVGESSGTKRLQHSVFKPLYTERNRKCLKRAVPEPSLLHMGDILDSMSNVLDTGEMIVYSPPPPQRRSIVVEKTGWWDRILIQGEQNAGNEGTSHSKTRKVLGECQNSKHDGLKLYGQKSNCSSQKTPRHVEKSQPSKLLVNRCRTKVTTTSLPPRYLSSAMLSSAMGFPFSLSQLKKVKNIRERKKGNYGGDGLACIHRREKTTRARIRYGKLVLRWKIDLSCLVRIL